MQRREFARHNPRDADAYHRYSTDVMRQCKFIRPLLLRSPPDPTSFKPRDIREMLFLGRELNKFGEQFIYDTIRFYSMSIADFLNEYFESDTDQVPPVGQRHHRLGHGRLLARHGLRAAAPLHGRRRRLDRRLGLRARRHGRGVEGDRESSFKSFGGEIVTDAPVERVLVKGGRVTGVVTENGNEYHAEHRRLEPRPAADLHQDLRPEGPAARDRREGEELQDPRLVRQAQHRARRAAGVPGARQGQPAAPTATCISSIRSRRYERAYDDWKNGTWSKEPYLDLLIPSMTDPTMAPPGKHFMSVFVQYVPPKIHGRDWTDADREGFKDTVLDQIARYSPNFKQLVRHVEVPHAARARETRSASPRATSSRAS